MIAKNEKLDQRYPINGISLKAKGEGFNPHGNANVKRFLRSRFNCPLHSKDGLFSIAFLNVFPQCLDASNW